MEIVEFTKVERQLMQVLWKLKKAFVKEIIQELPEPKPAYSTVSTVVRILETKGVVAYEAFGKTHRYYPLISKEEYMRFEADKFLDNYFSNSIQDMFSFFVNEKKIDLKDAQQLLKMIDKIKD
ncbi:transcriptional regulator [Sphingobacterium faecium NBRC 15299]|uniref:BlaI/MecI/CopY family transcriptional regulator n=1 Tax=Sphingobacterium faecium TaxID=34087 RepID=UPI000D3AD5CE|nr:BlaI/MecI/CopY family transcriptional regulator [Sphingobacterium faecium]MQP28859.1 BlaI/MecI/CopY family transcriptional regulator [Sphingobacterium faecium]PTX07235.1 putative transcriptional regulator [Sphingobacterium faecium]GEM65741.1 transcriptional regulator [Sphingobacterium faecium NBRC 15299]